ncbi:MAG TPA: hypothetical protein DCZ91_00700 [Lachnospiraceae bacterium]|nr:hypothetical protein [Lachnospiraceae bacterium]
MEIRIFCPGRDESGAEEKEEEQETEDSLPVVMWAGNFSNRMFRAGRKNMRKKRNFIILAGILFFSFLFAGVILLSPFRTDTGIFIAAGSPFILFDGGSGEPVIMLCPEGKDNMLSKLKTGDKILIVHNGTMMLSYPAQMNVYFCIRLKKGDVSDVPEGVMESLEEMGWKQGGTIV